jgi:hypothetical protein
MKTLLFIIVSGILMTGCASFKESEFMKHNTHFKNWDHMKYSLSNTGGYKTLTPEEIQQSQEEGWWGIQVK